MALYIDDDDIWKCPKHPSRRRRTGICHLCLYDRLSSLCPDCASVRPCNCGHSLSSTSSFSRFSSADAADVGAIGRVSNLIDREPAFRRSTSIAIPFLRSQPSVTEFHSSRKENVKTMTSFWSLFKSNNNNNGNKSKRVQNELNDVVLEMTDDVEDDIIIKDKQRNNPRMSKSRSMAVTSDSGGSAVHVRSVKGKSWYFSSPIKVFRRVGLVQQRSPLFRG